MFFNATIPFLKWTEKVEKLTTFFKFLTLIWIRFLLERDIISTLDENSEQKNNALFQINNLKQLKH